MSLRMDNLKRLKKGEVLFKENDPISHIYVVQSGRLSLQVERTGKRLEVMTAGASQLVGEQAIFTSARHMFTAEAAQETKVMEVPVETFKSQLSAAPAGVRLLLKSIVDDVKTLRTAVRAQKLEQDKIACPQPAIPRMFSLLNLVARHTGKATADKPGEWLVDWGTLKLYVTRMFAESPQRMRGVLDLLVKLKLATAQVGVTEEGEEELKKVLVHDLQFIEDFAEFYQYNLYKGGYSEVIHVDTLALKVAKALAALAEPLETDRKGAVTLMYDVVLSEVRSRFSFELKNTHLDVLEKKGLFVKRQSRDDGTVFLSYDRQEYLRISRFWAVIHEIDKWNERGFVDMNEKEEKAAAPGSDSCPQCQGVIDAEHKFCPHCGAKLSAAA